MLDKIRTKLNDVIHSPRGDEVAAVRVPKMFARRLNRVLGNPLCTAEDLEKRRAALAKLADHVIDNSGDRAATEAQVRRVHTALVADQQVRTRR